MKKFVAFFVLGLFIFGLGMTATSGTGGDLTAFYQAFQVAGSNYTLDTDYGVGVAPPGGLIFDDVPLPGKFLLVIDRSGSMAFPSYKAKGALPLPMNINQTKWLDGEKFKRKSDGYYKWIPEYVNTCYEWLKLPDPNDENHYSRWEFLKTEFGKAMDSLTAGTEFNVILFGDSSDRVLDVPGSLPGAGGLELFKKFDPDTQVNYGDQAKTAVNNITITQQATNMHHGMDRALQAQGHIEGIFLICDGEPTVTSSPNKFPTNSDIANEGYQYRHKYSDYMAGVLKLVAKTKTCLVPITVIWVGGSLSGETFDFILDVANVPLDPNNPETTKPDPNRPIGTVIVK
jgi:hypothetical protein